MRDESLLFTYHLTTFHVSALSVRHVFHSIKLSLSLHHALLMALTFICLFTTIMCFAIQSSCLFSYAADLGVPHF